MEKSFALLFLSLLSSKPKKPNAQIKALFSRGNAVAEFSPALFIFFFLFLYPFIALIQFGCGCATVYFISIQAAQAAAVSPDFKTALTQAQAIGSNLANSGLGQFAHLSTPGPAGNSVSLYVDVTPIGGVTAAPVPIQSGSIPPAITSPIDPTTNIYEYEARSNYTIQPYFNLSGIPILSGVPLLGQPVNIQFSATRVAEFPYGLASVPGPP